MPILIECLLYFTSIGTMLVFFASTITIIFWLLFWVLKTLVLLLVAGPEAVVGSFTQFRPQNLDYLKRAGQ